MNFKQLLLGIAGLPLLMSSCGEIENPVLKEVPYDGGTITEYYFDQIPKDTLELKLSELFSDYDIIPLETCKECMIGIIEFKIWNDEIFTATTDFRKPARVLRFNEDGNFLNEIGRGGKGPGEHVGFYVPQLNFDESNNTILVEWSGTTRDGLQIFKLDGEFIGDVKEPHWGFGSVLQLTENEWFSTGNCDGRPEYFRDSVKLLIYSRSGEIIKSIPRLDYPAKSTGFMMGFGNSEFKYGNIWKVYIGGIDTIFKIEGRDLIPTEVIFRGKDGVPFNTPISQAELPGKFLIDILHQNDHNSFFLQFIIDKAEINEYQPGKYTGMFYQKYGFIIADKKSKTARYVKLTDDIFQFLPDGLLNQELEWLKHGTQWVWQDNGTVSLALYATGFLKILEDSGPPEDLSRKASEVFNKIQDVDEFSNPIIFTFKLKDHIELN